MNAAIPKDSTPYAALHLPFANEDEMQRFVEEHAEDIFGLEVIASSNRGGELFEIDVLALNAANTPVKESTQLTDCEKSGGTLPQIQEAAMPPS